jgi:hypothetical protein
MILQGDNYCGPKIVIPENAQRLSGIQERLIVLLALDPRLRGDDIKI